MKPVQDNSKDLVARGQFLAEQGKLEQATEIYLQAIALDVDNYLAYYHLAGCLVMQKRLTEAIKFYRYSLKLNSNFSWSHHALADLLLQQDNFASAIYHYRQAIALNSHHVWSYMGLANAYKATDDQQQAIFYYQQALTIEPKLFWAHFNLGILYRQQGDYHQTVLHLAEAIQLDPHWQASYQILEYVPIPEVQLPQLIELYQQVVEQEPELSCAWSNLGDIFTRTKNTESAIICYRQAVYHKAISHSIQLADPQKKDCSDPKFIIIGELKCGTTSLYEYLGQHPQILTPYKKEVNFFNWHFEQGVDWYRAHFPQVASSFITGEASPAYFPAPLAAQRMAELLPQVKLIVLLRNPIERCVSHYHHCVRYGIEKNDLEVALSLEISSLKQATKQQLAVHQGYLGNSMYVYKLQRWLSLFPRNQILILKSEELYQNPALIMSQVFSWLSLSHQPALDYRKYNAASYEQINQNLRHQLSRFFEPHNRLLETYLGRKFDWS